MLGVLKHKGDWLAFPRKKDKRAQGMCKIEVSSVTQFPREFQRKFQALLLLKYLRFMQLIGQLTFELINIKGELIN